MHVVAEMVASVHSFEAEIGDKVSAGDTLLILESMKMEIPVFGRALWRGQRIRCRYR